VPEPIAAPFIEPSEPVLATMFPMELRVAKLVVELTFRVVKLAGPGVVLPMVPGTAKVKPFTVAALRLATLVVEVITRGAVPIDTVQVICPVADKVVKAPEAGTVPPIEGGEAKRVVIPVPDTVPLRTTGLEKVCVADQVLMPFRRGTVDPEVPTGGTVRATEGLITSTNLTGLLIVAGLGRLTILKLFISSTACIEFGLEP